MRFKQCLAAAVAALMLVSCGSSELIPADSDVTITFSWWCNGTTNNYTDIAVEQFVRMNPDIDVFSDFDEPDTYRNRMLVSYAAGKAPDVMQMRYDWMCRLAAGGEGFYDLSELSEHIDLSTYSANQLSYGTVNGKLIGIPIALDVETFFYNRDIYDSYGLSLPEKWNDVFRAASVMSKDGVYPIEMDKTAAWLACVAYREQNKGLRCFDSSGRLRFDRNDFSEMLIFYRSLIDEKVMKHYSERDDADLENGVSAGVLCWISESEERCQPMMRKGYSLSIGSYLNTSGSIISGWYAKPTGLYCIKRDTKHPTEAAKLVDFLINSQEMAQLQGTDKGIPLSRAMLEVLEADEALSGLQYQANNRLQRSNLIDSISPCQEDSALIDAFDSAVQQMLYDDADPYELAWELYKAAAKAALR